MSRVLITLAAAAVLGGCPVADTDKSSDTDTPNDTDTQKDSDPKSDTDTTTDTDPKTDTDTEPVVDSIADVRASASPGDPVELPGLVVTAVSPEGLWAQDAVGGAGTGLFFDYGTAESTTPPAVGDIIDTVGVVKSFDNDGAWSRARTQVELSAWTDTGSDATPVASTVAPDTLLDAEADWEGCLIRLSAGDDLAITALDGGIAVAGVPLGDTLHDLGTLGTLLVGDTWTDITGVFVDADGYALAPRTAEDLVGFVDAGGTRLPVMVTDHYFPSGYFGEWSTGDLWTVASETQTPGACPVRGGLARGDCLAVTYARDPDGDGMGPNYSGTYWQFPDDNWGQDDDGNGQPDLGEGFDMPAGATQVSFYAWGQTGAERVNFKTGIHAPDGFERATGILTLTTTPTQYTIDVSAISYTYVTGGFAWLYEWDVAPLGTSWTFYVDDIVWE